MNTLAYLKLNDAADGLPDGTVVCASAGEIERGDKLPEVDAVEKAAGSEDWKRVTPAGRMTSGISPDERRSKPARAGREEKR